MEGLYNYIFCMICLIYFTAGRQLVMPGSCPSDRYYEPGLLSCLACTANSSLVTSKDGFGCSCEDHSVPLGMNKCKPCNATQMVSTDGSTCVPRRCQNTSGKYVCRKCPSGYVSVTQNVDGSPLKEVQCVKCARGFREDQNICVRCEACTCTKQQVVVRGICIPKSYLNTRPKYEENSLHPKALLDVVKHEYLCTQNNVRACRTLAGECVRNFYSIDPAGPCRLWIQPNISTPKVLSPLTIESTSSDKYPGEGTLPHGKDILTFAAAIYTGDGGIKILKEPSNQNSPCDLPVRIIIGQDIIKHCTRNLSSALYKIEDDLVTIMPFLYSNGNIVQIPVYPRKPNGYSVQKRAWQSEKFKRYFIVDRSLSITTNTTVVVYLRTLQINIRVERDTNSKGSLRMHVSIEAHYSTKSSLTDTVDSTLRVTHVMPEAGVHRGLEIWGGVLGCLSILYAMVQWRGVVRRGGLYISIVPLLASSVADTLHFATWFSTIHALAAEAGTLGLTLPLSHLEENVIKILVCSAVALKAIQVVWFNFKQCRCDIFFLDWSQYNPPFRDIPDKSDSWKPMTLAREWSRMQTIRKVSPGLTATLTLAMVHILTPWQSRLPPGLGYKWAVGTIAWWSSYTIFLIARWMMDRMLGSPTDLLPKICHNIGLSLLVFEEEHYAHYVHGRDDDSKDLRGMAGPLATCRIVCAPQLRIVYKHLSLSVPGLGETDTRQALLSRFLAAFFERALDGLSWVASERTILERLLNVELTTREAGNTSTLLYDPEERTPSCYAVTWWGEEWTLSTFDAMVFGCVLITTDHELLAALITLVLWQILKLLRSSFGNMNQREKTETRILL